MSTLPSAKHSEDTLCMPNLQAMLAASPDLFGNMTDTQDGDMESDGYSSASSDNSPESPCNFHQPVATSIQDQDHSSIPSGYSQATPDPDQPTNTGRAHKVPNLRLSQIARAREHKKRSQRKAAAEAAARRSRQEQVAASESLRSTQHEKINKVLQMVNELGLTMGDMICHFFNPENHCNQWDGFWKDASYFEEFIACVTTRKNATRTGRERVYRWALDYVKQTVHREAQRITASRILQSRHLPIDEDFVFRFRFGDLQVQLTEGCPVMTEIVEGFATSTVQERRMKKTEQAKVTSAKLKKSKVVATTLLSLLREHNQYNNRFQQILALFMYASGLQRQCYSILSHLGVVVAYASLVRTTPRAIRQKDGEIVLHIDSPADTSKPRRLGLLPELCLSLRAKARRFAEEEVTMITYDNINFMSRVGEQTIGHKDMQENGTCATLVQVPGVTTDDLNLSEYWDCLLSAPPFQLNDMALTADEYRLEQQSHLQTVLGIVIDHGGEYFTCYKKLLSAELPDSIPAGAYKPCPLPAMDICEGSVDGNIDVFERITEVTSSRPNRSPDRARIWVGDQLSMAHFRRALTWRVGNEDLARSMAESVCAPGLFHVEMTFVTLLLENFWGLPSSEANPASLWAHNTLLGRKKIVLSSPPPFRTALDLLLVSLYSRVLVTLPLAAGSKDLAAYASSLAKLDGPNPKDRQKSWACLKADVGRQLEQYANTKVAARLRREREDEAIAKTHAQTSNSASPLSNATDHPASTAGDMVFEAGVLFFNMALRLKSFIEAMKRGDSSRAVAIIKTLTLACRGTRHTKYAYELIVFLHNHTHVWPPPLRARPVRDAIMKSWLVNLSGKPNSYKPADLMQEHFNLQIKTIYKANGSNQSWEWLSMISPCVHVLRQVAREFHTTLGDRQGTKHSAVSIADDIRALSESLIDNGVYEIRRGRAFDRNDPPPKDVVSEGYRRLAYGSKRTIENFNQYFLNLQRRFNISPVSTMLSSSLPDQAPASVLGDSNPEGQINTAGTKSIVQGFETLDNAVEESEDNVDSLFDWDGRMQLEDVGGIGFSDEETGVDEDSVSDGEM